MFDVCGLSVLCVVRLLREVNELFLMCAVYDCVACCASVVRCQRVCIVGVYPMLCV